MKNAEVDKLISSIICQADLKNIDLNENLEQSEWQAKDKDCQ